MSAFAEVLLVSDFACCLEETRIETFSKSSWTGSRQTPTDIRKLSLALAILGDNFVKYVVVCQLGFTFIFRLLAGGNATGSRKESRPPPTDIRKLSLAVAILGNNLS